MHSLDKSKQNLFIVLIFIYINMIRFVYCEMKLPDSMPLCKKSDPNLNQCLKVAIQKSYPALVNGLPQFDLPPLEPLHIHEIILDQDSESSVRIKLRLSHSYVHGLSQLEVTSVDADWDNYRIKVNVNVKKILITGDYEIDGKILVLPISGSGKFNFTFEGGSAHIELLGQGVTKNGMTYMDVKDISWNYDTEHMIIEMENLFNGDKGRSDNMNAFLNEHWRDVIDELKETMQQSYGESFKEFAKHIFDNVPIDYIALP